MLIKLWGCLGCVETPLSWHPTLCWHLPIWNSISIHSEGTEQLFWELSSSQKEHNDLLKFQILLCLGLLETGTNSSSSSLPQIWMKISELSLLWWLSNIPFHHVPCFAKSKTESQEVTVHLKVTWQGRKRAWMSAPRFLPLRAHRDLPDALSSVSTSHDVWKMSWETGDDFQWSETFEHHQHPGVFPPFSETPEATSGHPVVFVGALESDSELTFVLLAGWLP